MFLLGFVCGFVAASAIGIVVTWLVVRKAPNNV